MCGCKRVQQAFTDRNVLLRFVNEEEADVLLKCMVPQFLLHKDDAATAAAVADAIANPSKYVLKTQEEATGSVIVGQELVEMLSVPRTDPRFTRIRHDHLLMQRIVGHTFTGSVLRDGTVSEEKLESE